MLQVAPPRPGAQENEEAITEADAGRQHELAADTEDIIGNRHTEDEKKRPSELNGKGGSSRLDDSEKLSVAGKAPHGRIHPEQGEDDEAKERIPQRERLPGGEILDRNIRKLTVKPEP